MWWMSLRAERTEPLYYLPSYTAAPTLNLTVFNPKTKSNTNPIAALNMYTELQVSSASPKSSALAILYKY